eukprot:CAMPEP_0117507938 /NCGR_PEP_ID=MMETSP0784-20121206/26683_1 /TAXON_ID=39447 /ORGANISM="" /LENGTH=460 /DNA_ID=CAMNT_0005303461 /DNA_START=47 /DNA_END=1429 /DNA_ORIENTATION=+
MEDYQRAQREKWLRQQVLQSPGANGSDVATSASDPSAAPSHGGAAGATVTSSGAAAANASSSRAASSSASASAFASTDPAPPAQRVHILPIGNPLPEDLDHRRFELLAPGLREKRGAKEAIRDGTFIHSSGFDFVVVKCEPADSVLCSETDYFVEGAPIAKIEKVQFVGLWDFESRNKDLDPSTLFDEYIGPYFRQRSKADVGHLVTVGDVVKISDMEFQIMAAEPSPRDIGIIDSNTMVFVDWDATPEFDKIHIVPFQDTLPHAYEFDIFNDYLKPFLTKNKHMRFEADNQFTYQGVQFKVVCCEPAGPARIGHNTTIYCEGVLHPSLRNLLPPELLEQLSQLPPGLQMLLLNTEALAGGYEERLMEVQEMLSRRRGLSNETISRVDKFSWEDPGSGGSQTSAAQTQCMVCLSNFAQGEEVRRLPCSHVFHARCIDEWLRRCTDCPICKADVDRAMRDR